MSGVITTGIFPKDLWPGLNAHWGASYYTEKAPEWSELFPTYESYKSYEEDVGTTGIGLAPLKPEGDSLQFDTMKQGYVSRYTNIAIATGFIITREELQDNLYAEVGPQRARNLAFGMKQSKENIGANIFNRAFNPSYTGGDSVPLISLSHPTEAGLQANRPTVALDLCEAALEEALVDISLFKDNRGNLINVQAKCLVVPPLLAFEATRLIKNPQRPGTADRDISAIYAMDSFPEGIKVNHYLTDPNAFFILTNCPDALKHFQREKARFEQDNDFSTKNGLFSGYERYSFGWSDWRGVYGSPGA